MQQQHGSMMPEMMSSHNHQISCLLLRSFAIPMQCHSALQPLL